MKSLSEKFEEFNRDEKLFSTGDSLLLAVSGGIDSMVLLNLLKNSEVAVSVAHCNFTLRGSESDKDEKFVRDECNKLNIPVYTRSFDTRDYARSKGISTQMAARELRYQWFNSLLQDKEISLIATAHHATDQLETVLMNFIHGRGVSGSTGILPQSGNRIRPLLFATRGEILYFAQNKNIPWREDSSNAETDYQRNFIRHNVVPHLRKLNPSLEETTDWHTTHARFVMQVFKAKLKEWKKSWLKIKDENIIVLLNELFELPEPYMQLFEALKKYGLHTGQFNELKKLIAAKPGKKMILPEYTLYRDRNTILIRRSVPSQLAEKTTINVIPAHARFANRIFHFEVADPAQITSYNKAGEAFFDLETLTFPLTIRKWKHGDRFVPLGMKNNQKVSDFLVNNKIPLPEKDDVYVMEDAKGIVWIIGFRPDDRCKITDNTSRLLHITYRNTN